MLKSSLDPRPQPRSAGVRPQPGIQSPPILGAYISGDEVEREDARNAGYKFVGQHPSEVGVLGGDDTLVLDANTAMFGDLAEVVQMGLNAARSGVRVGIHTYNPGHPLLAPLAKVPGVIIAHTHRDLRAELFPIPNIPRSTQDLEGLRVYAQGSLCIDRSILIHTTLPEFLAVLHKGKEKLRVEWEDRGDSVGGFTSWAVRSGASKGARMAIGAVLPHRLPAEFEVFIEEFHVDTQYLELRDGVAMARALRLHFADGQHLLIPDPRGVACGIAPPEDRFDVFLVNPGNAATRRPILEQLRHQRPGTTVGLVAREDWDRTDWELVKGSGFRVHLNQVELAGSAALSGAGSSDAFTTEEHLSLLRNLLEGSATVIATLGGKGSLLLNHVPTLVHATAAQVSVLTLVGAGDTQTATETLSAAVGAPDGRSLLRGNMDAARLISGKLPAASLADLDDEIARHVEMREEEIAMLV